MSHRKNKKTTTLTWLLESSKFIQQFHIRVVSVVFTCWGIKLQSLFSFFFSYYLKWQRAFPQSPEFRSIPSDKSPGITPAIFGNAKAGRPLLVIKHKPPRQVRGRLFWYSVICNGTLFIGAGVTTKYEAPSGISISEGIIFISPETIEELPAQRWKREKNEQKSITV